MKRRAIVHIGLPKTGTTAIQAYLAKNRGLLRDHGVALSAAAGRRNNIALAAYAQGKTNNAALRSGGDAHRKEGLEYVPAGEAPAFPESVPAVPFSGEQPGRVGDVTGRTRMPALLASQFDRIGILARRHAGRAGLCLAIGPRARGARMPVARAEHGGYQVPHDGSRGTRPVMGRTCP